MPGPLNGPSMALGTRADLLRMLPRLDPIDQDIILMNRIDGVTQTTLSNLLDIRSQAGISYRLVRATACLAHMAREPCPPYGYVREACPLAPPAMRGPLSTWAHGTMSFLAAMRWHGLVDSHPSNVARASYVLKAAVEAGRKQLSPEARAWLEWRLAMPRRFQYSAGGRSVVAAHNRARCLVRRDPPTPAQESILRTRSIPEARALLGLPLKQVLRLRAQLGIWGPVRREMPGLLDPSVTVRAVARASGISTATVRHHRVAAGLSGPGAPSKITREEALAKLAPYPGMTQAQISRATGVAQSTVYRWRMRAAGKPVKRY